MGSRPIPLADLFASPRPSPVPPPGAVPISSLFGQQPERPNPLEALFSPPPSPMPLAAPPLGPDEVEVPGSEPEPDRASAVERFFRNLRETALPEHVTDLVEGPGRAVLAAAEAASGRPQRLIDYAGLIGGAAVEGSKGQIEAAQAAPTMTEKAARYLSAAVPLIGPGIAQTGEKVGEQLAEGDYAGAAGQLAGNLIDPGMALGAVGRAGRIARAISAAPPSPLTAERVAAAITRERINRTGGPSQGSMEGRRPVEPPPLPKPAPKPITREDVTAYQESRRASTDVTLDDDTRLKAEQTFAAISARLSPEQRELLEAAARLRVGRAQPGATIWSGTEATGRYGTIAHPGKTDLGLDPQDFPQSAAEIAAALERKAAGGKSTVADRALAAMRKYADEQREAMEASRPEASRDSFDPDALELPAIEGAAHGVDDDYRGVVLDGAESMLKSNDGRGVVRGEAPTGQQWYGFRGEDGKISGALVFDPKTNTITDWAGSGNAPALVLRRAIREHPDLEIDFDTLSGDSAKILNDVMNRGGKFGAEVRRQWEAHLKETGQMAGEGGGTVPPGGADGPSAGVGSGEGGGRGEGPPGEAPRPEVAGGARPPEAQAGGGSGAPPNRPPTTEGVAGAGAPPPTDPVKKLLNLIRQAPAAIRETEGLRMSERIKRAADVSRALRSVGGRAGQQAARSALKGELPQADFSPVGEKLSGDEADWLLRQAQNHADLQPMERFRAAAALENIFDGGRIPQKNEIALLERVFGADMADALLSKRHWSKRLGETLVDAANLPRSLVSSFDMSAPLRQGLLLTVGRPKQAAGAAKHMFSAAFSQRAFDAVEKDIRARPNAELYEQSGLYLTGNTRAAGLSSREESFMSRLAERIPVVGAGVRASERAYVGYLNKLRADVFDSITAEWAKGGVTYEKAPSRYTGLAQYLNMATGRGHLGQLERIAPMMNAAFFSPRFMMARLQTLNPVTYAKMDPAVRRQAARDITSTLGAGIAVISLAKMAGADVETDPRSSDFGKIRVGRTRMDVWGGFQQPIRYLAQIATGQRKPEQGGIQPQRDRVETVGRFLRSKEAPIFSALHDLGSGKDFIGNEVSFESEAREMFSPMFYGDFMDAVREHGFEGAALAAPAFFGVGVTTHQPRGESAR